MRGRLVNWVEKARLDRICRLLKIIDKECHYDLLLSVKNLLELGASPFPYIMPVLPRPLPSEVIKGENFVLVDFLKLFPGGSSQAEVTPKSLV